MSVGLPEPNAVLAHDGVVLRPDWPVDPRVGALVTTRRVRGASRPPFDYFNLGARCGDAQQDVAHNRALLAAALGRPVRWLEQVHGTDVHVEDADVAPQAEPRADAAVRFGAGPAIAVLTADCLPVFVADRRGRCVGVAHAGWRGLLAGVLERTVERMRAGCPQLEPLAWLGPAIGPAAFEVGDEVRAAFVAHDPGAADAFVPGVREGKWFADLYALARRRLQGRGVDWIGGGGLCTVADAARFYSYRRDRVTGRMASIIWISH